MFGFSKTKIIVSFRKPKFSDTEDLLWSEVIQFTAVFELALSVLYCEVRSVERMSHN